MFVDRISCEKAWPLCNDGMLMYTRICPTFHKPIAALSTTWTEVLHRMVDPKASQGSAGLGGRGVCIGPWDDQVANEPPVCLYDIETRGRELTLSLRDAPFLTLTSVRRR